MEGTFYSVERKSDMDGFGKVTVTVDFIRWKKITGEKIEFNLDTGTGDGVTITAEGINEWSMIALAKTFAEACGFGPNPVMSMVRDCWKKAREE